MTKEIIVLKWESLALAITSVIYGAQIFIHPEIMDTYKVYSLIRDIFDAHLIGGIFVVLGSMKLIGIWTNYSLLKKLSLRGLTFLWLLFLIAFVITPPPNTVWVLAFNMIFLIVGVTIKEG